MSVIQSQNILINLQGNLQDLTDLLLIQYINDPLSTDERINSFVISQIGPVPITPKAYFENCGDFFLKKQTCEHRDRIRADSIRARDEYYTKYQSVRQALLNSMISRINSDTTKEQKKVLFVAGNKTLQDQINKISQDIERSAALNKTIWSLASSIPVIGQVISVARKYIVKEANVVSPERPDLHRFSEIPPEILTRDPVNFLPQWIGVISMVRVLEVAKEYQILYTAAYPPPLAQTLVQNISSNGNTIAFVALGAIILKKLKR